jgi:hypothetical protein
LKRPLEGIDNRRLSEELRLPLRAFAYERQRHRREQNPEVRDVVHCERHVTVAIGDAQDAEHVRTRGHRTAANDFVR